MALHSLLVTIFLLSGFTAAAFAGLTVADQSLPAMARLDSIDPVLLEALGHSRHFLSFAQFAQKYGKSYGSVEEIRKRFGIFMENLELIKSTNRKGLSYTLGSSLTGLGRSKASWLGAPQNCSATLKGNHKLTEAKLPDTRDWRKFSIVSPVKDQGSCGSCWSFSTTGALEAAYKQLTGKGISLSEQQLVDCASAFNNHGCGGGLPSQAFEYVKYNGGLETEEAYPYKGVNGTCDLKKKNIGVKVIDSVNITTGAEDELKQAVGLVRPVSIAFEVVRGFRLYKKGVYKSDKCGSSPMDVNHAVLAVGYGVEGGVPYWIIKNSWGKDWGDNGFFKMELGKNMCGIATCASYPIVSA
ncbi:hypothetical protein M5K25_012612 [Dendrobium thyrsiflorum]|uniref:Cysteine protease n=1 Tax=Dendrobium thyrsiflorum TaxID=117978 RepID=A0ABD0V4T5_DENTH